jgi:drug/metabolite transporter (DMT)-like permease
MKTALMIALVVLGSSGGEVFIARGMREVGEFSTLQPGALVSMIKRVLGNKYFLAGVFLMAVGYFALLGALSGADLSLTVPATSISFAIKTASAKFYLKERISLVRWAGILLVCVGVVLVSLPE